MEFAEVSFDLPEFFEVIDVFDGFFDIFSSELFVWVWVGDDLCDVVCVGYVNCVVGYIWGRGDIAGVEVK